MESPNGGRKSVRGGLQDKRPPGKISKILPIIIVIALVLLVVAYSGCVGSTNQAPTCHLLASPNFGDHPLNVTFSLGAGDMDGSIASWTLDVDGDGTPEYSGTGDPPQVLDHAYEFSGEYAPILRVTDDGGGSAEASDNVSVL